MSEETLCQRCGAPFSGPQSHQPTCPKCLMELGLSVSSLWITGSGEAPSPPPAPEEIQRLLPDYRVASILGQGGMGVVYRAHQLRLQRDVALKVLPPGGQRDDSFPARFEREARALAALSHPGITTIFDFGEAEGHCWFAMELVEGVNLRELMRTQKLSPAQALDIVGQVCAALQYAHSQDVVHRDIKPENVLVDRDGVVKITDFGLAKVLGRSEGASGLTGSYQVMGTPHYMAPEQIERPGRVDHRADIYSLGVVFYELLTGELPIGRFGPPSGRAQIDVRLDEVVLRTLEKEPERRYQAAQEVATAVSSIAETPDQAPRRSASKRGESSLRDQLLKGLGIAMIVSVVLLALIGAGAGDWLGWSGDPEQAAGHPSASEQPQGESSFTAMDMRRLEAQVELERYLYLDSVEGVGAGKTLRDGLEEAFLAYLALHHPQALASSAGLVQALSDALASYLALERSHTQARVADDRRLHLQLSTFSDERAALQAALQERLDEIAGEAGALDAGWLTRGIMPFGEQDLELVIEEDDQRRSGTILGDSMGRSLSPRAIGYYWGLVAPLPVSAMQAADLLLAELAPLMETGQLELSSLRTTTPRATGTTTGEISVEAGIDITGESVVAAHEVLAELRAGLLDRSWCREVSQDRTDELEQGHVGIHVGLNLRLRLPGAPELRLVEELAAPWELDLDMLVRGLAADEQHQLGGMSLSSH